MSSPTLLALRLLKGREVESRLGIKHTSRAAGVKEGTITKPIRRSAIDAVWPEHEIQAIAAATIAGQTKDQIKQLVVKLHADRAQLSQAAP